MLMPSISLARWRLTRRLALDELESAHQRIGGSGRGRRYATTQINYAYAVILASQFQGYCRDLHSECVEYFVQSIVPPALSRIVGTGLLAGRFLDRGNAHGWNLQKDFERLGVTFWDDVKKLDARNERRSKRLEELNTWRNAIAHQNFANFQAGSALKLQQVRIWRAACNHLAVAFDTVIRNHVHTTTGIAPW
jgi:hypothetical protein